jgi:hypothetical protein
LDLTYLYAGLGPFVFFGSCVGLDILLLIPTVFYLRTLQRAVARRHPAGDTKRPGRVWLQFIPVAGMWLRLSNVVEVGRSLRDEGQSLRLGYQPTSTAGFLACGFQYLFSAMLTAGVLIVDSYPEDALPRGPEAAAVACFLLLVGAFFGFVISWIVYWKQISQYVRLVDSPPDGQPAAPGYAPVPGYAGGTGYAPSAVYAPGPSSPHDHALEPGYAPVPDRAPLPSGGGDPGLELIPQPAADSAALPPVRVPDAFAGSEWLPPLVSVRQRYAARIARPHEAKMTAAQWRRLSYGVLAGVAVEVALSAGLSALLGRGTLAFGVADAIVALYGSVFLAAAVFSLLSPHPERWWDAAWFGAAALAVNLLVLFAINGWPRRSFPIESLAYTLGFAAMFALPAGLAARGIDRALGGRAADRGRFPSASWHAGAMLGGALLVFSILAIVGVH